MNARPLLLLSLIMLISACSDEHIKLEVEGPFPGKLITLKALDAETMSYQTIDTATADARGKASFLMPFAEPNILFLSFGDLVHAHISADEPGRIRVRHDGRLARFRGSELSARIAGFDAELEKLKALHLSKIETSLQQALLSNDPEKIALNQAILDTAMRAFILDFRAKVDDMGINPAAFYALQFADFSKELGYLEQKLRAFDAEYPNSPMTLTLRKQVEQYRATTIGHTPPRFDAIDQEGMPVSPDMYLGNYLFIDFWASWCPPCRTENPLIAAVYEKYIAYGLQMLGIAPMKNENEWRTAIETDGVGAWSQIMDENWEISKKFHVYSLPQNILLNEEGRIVARNISSEELDTLLAGTFGTE